MLSSSAILLGQPRGLLLRRQLLRSKARLLLHWERLLLLLRRLLGPKARLLSPRSMLLLLLLLCWMGLQWHLSRIEHVACLQARACLFRFWKDFIARPLQSQDGLTAYK